MFNWYDSAATLGGSARGSRALRLFLPWHTKQRINRSVDAITPSRFTA